ncbi:NUDIX hydrolase [uncultured Amnibacterium sp.]|uniref:NUDIX hydrolase n=1 Tax=uncultured Amnibacterium sp. TaxID=1631851 RepID=UPI0035CA0A0E
MKTPPRPIVRNAARTLLLDPDGRVLLIRGHDPEAPEAGHWWLTPGGGLEPGEDARAAAVREAFEETGHEVADLVGPVARRSSVFRFDGRLIEQRELYFVARVEAFEATSAGWTPLEQRVLGEARWWTLDELRTTGDTVFPEHLADLVAAALAG